MRFLLCASLTAAMIAGCEQSATPSLDGVTVRRIDSAQDEDLLFEIRVPGAGWLGVGLGPMNSDSMMWISTTGADDRTIVLRVEREDIAADTVMEKFVSPLFGDDAVEQLRAQRPEADDRKLVMTTLVLEQRNGTGGSRSRIGPVVTLIPAGAASTSTALADTLGVDAAPVRLAAWLYVPQQPGAPVGMGIGRDGITIADIHGDLTIEEAGAVFEERTLQFAEERPTLARR